MNNHEKESASARSRRESHENELALCDEAVKSGDYDALTDRAWDRLCEEAAARGQNSAPRNT